MKNSDRRIENSPNAPRRPEASPECYAVVVTTINAPTRAVIEIARDASRLSARFVLVGDERSPADFSQPGATYLDLKAQLATGFELARIQPAGHYARKNIGYLAAIREGATVIIETDDDNIPLPEFWRERRLQMRGRVFTDPPWVNVYKCFSQGHIWPRGLPLDRVRDPAPNQDAPIEERACPIQQGLANDNPDVDAIYRLLMPLPVKFDAGDPVLLAGASWCPFNSQNTTWWRQAFPLLYLPFYCSFRMTDIWRSFVAQRICAANSWTIGFHGATVMQDRNEHDLMRDFEEEVPGYLHNTRIRSALDALQLSPGADAMSENMRLCYRALIDMGVISGEEAPLLDAWLNDLAAMG